MEETKTIDKSNRKFNKKLSAIIVFLLVLILMTATISVAWLSNEADVAVNYSIIQLNMDISANHMYTYYAKNKDDTTTFISKMKDLETIQKKYKNEDLSKTNYEEQVKSILEKIYPKGFVDSLIALQTETYKSINSSNIDNYNSDAKALYKKYSSYINMPFDYRNVDIDKIDISKGLLYYSVDSILILYADEYVSQYKDGYNASTVPIQVKLKGGTTYSDDTDGEYYDNDFNDMVLPVSTKFTNTGSTNMYMYYAVTDGDGNNTYGCGNGILTMIEPYGYDFSTLSVDGSFSKGDYRKLVAYVLTHYGDYLGGNSGFSGFTGSSVEKMSYSDLVTTLKSWNAAAIKTYYNSANGLADATTGNLLVKSLAEDSNNFFKMNMLCWADYETCYKQYNKEVDYSGTPIYQAWDTGASDYYGLYTTNFYINFRSSLKNLTNLATTADFDESMQYNQQGTVDKVIGVSNFEVEGNAYFDQDGDNVYTDTSDKLAINYMSGGYINLNYTDKTANNYVGKFRLDFRYRGFSPANVRVRLIEQWTNSAGDIVGINLIPFKFDSDWTDNRGSDLYMYSKKLYYSSDSKTKLSTGKAKLFIQPIITGLDSNFIDSDGVYFDPTLGTTYKNLTLKMSILIEAVQPNRVDEFWDLGNYNKLDDFIDNLK